MRSQIYKILGHAFSSSCFLTSTLHLSSIFMHNAVLATLSRNGWFVQSWKLSKHLTAHQIGSRWRSSSPIQLLCTSKLTTLCLAPVKKLAAESAETNPVSDLSGFVVSLPKQLQDPPHSACLYTPLLNDIYDLPGMWKANSDKLLYSVSDIKGISLYTEKTCCSYRILYALITRIWAWTHCR